ncbi:DUF2218 domain-containing protein [Acinetobacter indicus]|uniref:DUF2218 domain-containing protein n=1 Tax=Acinetobacter indicus TaxID=756892 RepID=UPI00094894EE|nr:DUF2218 domain-containing protein [Acinetobacter indicus]MCO8088658.1 DUF2218 domain-containing protein [Acinetobacter indicus]MCO8103429.1 DUF2218 domain-containing protein [Acinetobacter indicus]MDM1270870.1 DUF2218 domain-containing protein [Acinetobacter indicus]MDM1291819.1 DUF2218 domain-containing protein [Acinetobacter indicus]MDM1321793.1 DUF2218 domain-containing protein [Acinetobacter indicus]
MKRYSHIATTQAARLAKRLGNHWKHKFEVQETAQELRILMPSATIVLQPQPDALYTEIIAQDEHTDLNRLEQVVLDHLQRMGQEQLSADWQQAD